MGVVETQNPTIITVVQRQGVPDAMRNLLLRIYPVRLELCPLAVVHGKDLAIQIQQGDKGFIFRGITFFLHGHNSYLQMIIYAMVILVVVELKKIV